MAKVDSASNRFEPVCEAGIPTLSRCRTGLNSMSFTPQVDRQSPVQTDGNNVNIDTEMSDLSENALDYQSLVQIADARLKMLSIAMGSPQ